jgi:hypothetical protein
VPWCCPCTQSLLSKQRQLVQEGEFNYRRKSKRGFKPGLHFFLFNDMLLLARPRCRSTLLTHAHTHAFFIRTQTTRCSRSAVGRVSSLMTGSDASWKMSAYSQLSQVEVQDIPDSKGTCASHPGSGELARSPGLGHR